MNTEFYEKIVTQNGFKSLSVVQGISATDSDFINLNALLGRIEFNDEFSGISYKLNGEDTAELILVYQQSSFKFEVSVDRPAISEMFTLSHNLSPTELKRLQNAGLGLTVKTHFGKDNLGSFHLQVKLIHSILPNIAGIVDYCSYSILSGRWVKLAAASTVPPSPTYLYRTHAVNDNDDVWMHTHGLNRCGSVELEIIGATTQDDGYQALASIIDTLATMVIQTGTIPAPKEPITIGDGIVVTWIKWEEAIKDLNKLGCTDADRRGHDEPSGVLYLYQSEEDYKNGKFTHLNEVVQHLQENPLFFISNEETKRMYDLAHERLSYVYEMTFKNDNKTLIKAGIEVDDEYKQDGEVNKEHLWFEVVDINQTRFTGILLNQPYYISGMNEGDQLDVNEVEITDWIIYTKEHQVSPDNVYLIENKAVLPYETFSNRDKLLEQLELWHSTNQHNNIIDACLQIDELDYELASIYARALNNIGDLNGAIEQLLKVEETGKDDCRWHYKLAYAYDSLGEYEKAIGYLDKSIELDETYVPAFVQLAYVFYSMGKYAKAIEAFEKSFEIDKDDFHYTKGEKEHLYSVMEECKVELKREEKVKFYNQLEQLHDEGKHNDIVDEINKSTESDYHLGLLKARAFINLDKFEEANSQLIEIKEQGEKHSTWHLYLSQALEALGNQKEADLAKEMFAKLKEKEEQYITVMTSKDYISVPFYIEKEKVFKIGQKLNELNEQAYMNGYNWEALLQYYMSKNHPELADHVEHDPEAGMYVGYFKNIPDNAERANAFMEIITDLVENEEKLYQLVRNEGDSINWD